MSDFTTGREIHDDLPPAPEVERAAPVGGEVFGERMGLAPDVPAAVSAEPETVTPRISDGLTEGQREDLADYILSGMGDRHSGYDIDERNGPFALVHTFEVDEDSLFAYALPYQEELSFSETREAMLDKIINRIGPSVIPELRRDPPSPAAELENARLTDEVHERAEVETREPPSGMLSGKFIGLSLNKHMKQTAELIAGAIIGYFVSEPELTPQQVRDLMRASAERDESRAVELAGREAEAGLVTANWDINHNRSPVPGGAGDEVRRGESVFDRYPGLTRDDSGGTQEHESDRAFYDMGIERER